MKWTLIMPLLLSCGRPPAAEPTETATTTAPAESAEQHAGPTEHHAAHSHGAHDHMKGPQGHRFEKAEEWAPRFDNPDRDAWQRPDLVVKHMSLSDGMVVADIGAGTGYFLPHLSRHVGSRGKVLGLDIEPDMVRYMTERAKREKLTNVEARVVATDDPRLTTASMDRILVVDTWHHIGNRTDYARKLAAALAPGGEIYIVDFTMETKRGPPPTHRLTSATIIGELTAAGLTAEVVPADLPDQYIIVAR